MNLSSKEKIKKASFMASVKLIKERLTSVPKVYMETFKDKASLLYVSEHRTQKFLA